MENKAVIYTDEPVETHNKGRDRFYEGPFTDVAEKMCKIMGLKIEKKQINYSYISNDTICPPPFVLLRGHIIPKMHLIQILKEISMKSDILVEPKESMDDANMLLYAIVFRLHAAIVFVVVGCTIGTMGKSLSLSSIRRRMPLM